MTNEALKISRKLAWRLRHMMVERNILTAAALARRLAEIGFEIHQSQLTRILKDRPVEIKTEFIDALIEVLQCDIQDILRAEKFDSSASPVPTGSAPAPAPKKAAPKPKKRVLAPVLPEPDMPRVSLVPKNLGHMKTTDPK
jgi:ribosomal protein L12E/L44/L45/RPP1/RPP2